MVRLKLRAVGTSIGVVLPKEVLNRLNLSRGDELFLTEGTDGYRITPYDPCFEKQMQAAQGIMKRRRQVLHELAK